MKFVKSHSNHAFLIPLSTFKIPAGFPSPALDYIEDRIDLAKQLAPHPLSTYYSYCEGDSMIDACIPPNAILVIDKSLNAKSGDIVVAFLNGGYTVKYIKLENDKCFLIPANKKKKYPIIEVTAEMEMVVWGVVTNVVIDTKYIRLCML